MTRQELTSLALKFFALYLLINLLNLMVVYGYAAIYTVWGWVFGSGYMLPVLGEGDRVLLAIIGVLAVGLPIGLSISLWKLAGSLSSKHRVEQDEPDAEPGFDNVVIMLVGVGLFVAITAFPQLLNSLQRLALEAGKEPGVSGGTIVWVIGSLLELLLGISLVLGRNGWRQLLFKLRYEPMYSNQTLYKDEGR